MSNAKRLLEANIVTVRSVTHSLVSLGGSQIDSLHMRYKLIEIKSGRSRVHRQCHMEY